MTPVADAYVDTSQPTVNFGTSTQLRMDGSPVVNGYIRFNVTGVSGTVTSATLRIFANSAQTTGYTASSVADTTWGETTINASNAPAFGAALGSSGKITAGTWTSADVTAAVTGNGLYTFGFSTTNATAVSFSSREGANPPQLVITWTSGAAVVPPILPQAPRPTVPPALLLLTLPLLAPALILLERRSERPLLRGFREALARAGAAGRTLRPA